MIEQALTQHLLELRKRLIYALLGFFIILAVLFPYANDCYQLLAQPLAKFLPGHSQLIATDITSPFFVPLKLIVLIAFIISLPNTAFQLWQFIAPGLYKTEKKLIASVITSSWLLFILGMVFCYFLVLPAVFHFIGSFKSNQISMLTDIDKYLSFVLNLFLVFGLAFEMPIVIFLLILFNCLSIKKAKQIRKYMFVGCFIIAAIVTPPDVLSQTMLAIPLYLLYELGIISAKLFIKSN